MGIMDDVFGQDPNNFWAWNLVIQQQAQQQAAAAAAQQAAANAAAQQQASTAVGAAAPTAPAGTAFDASPYRATVDAGFSQFTPEWFANQYQAAYSPYQTGVQAQYDTASDFLNAGLANRGQQNSNLSRGLFQQLDALKDQNLTAGQTAAQNYQGGLQSSVNTARTGLYDSITPTADNSTLGARTTAATDPIYKTQAPASTLGQNVFGDLVAPYATTRTPGGPVNPEEQAFATGGNLNLAGGGGGPGASTKVVGSTTPKKKKF